MDPEWIHERALGAIRTAERVPLVSHLTRAIFRKPKPVAIRGLHRPVPGRLGLAAGMDKNASVIAGMDMLGFGFVEVGTITAHPQPGNEPPRLWRELDLTGLRNRMGFNNAGAVAAGAALRALRGSRRGRSIVVGANLGSPRSPRWPRPPRTTPAPLVKSPRGRTTWWSTCLHRTPPG